MKKNLRLFWFSQNRFQQNILPFLIGLLCLVPLRAAEPKALSAHLKTQANADSTATNSDVAAGKTFLSGFPFMLYQPETSLIFGVGLALTLRLDIGISSWGVFPFFQIGVAF